MDGRRFDDLARALGGGAPRATRRRVFGGLAGAALAALGLGAARRGAGAQVDFTGWRCGGPVGLGCPAGYGCVLPAIPDPSGYGTCQRQAEPDGEPCGGALCGAGEYCCNESCGICAPIGGFCTAQLCGAEGGEPCNLVTCGAGEYCCNFSCSTCAPVGGACTLIACEG